MENTNKFKVLLVSTCLFTRHTYSTGFSLAIACLKSYAEKMLPGRADIKNVNFFGECENDFCETVKSFGPELIGFSCYLWNIDIVRGLCGIVRKEFPGVKILLGGPEATGRRETFLKETDSDFLIVGEGEDSFVKLLSALTEKRRPENIEGLILPDSAAEYALKCRSKLLPVEDFPFPYTVENMGMEPYPEMFFPMETMRGCANHCAYCTWTELGQRSVRYYSDERIAQNLEWVMKNAPRSRIFVCDSDTFANRERALRLAPLFLRAAEAGHTFTFQTNLNSWDEALMEAYSHPNYEFDIGINALALRTQKVYSREFSVESMEKKILAMKQKMPLTTAFIELMYASPGENLADFCKAIDWAFSQSEHPLFFHTQLFHGTPVHRNADKLKIVSNPRPPYYILSTADCSEEMLRIEDIMVIAITTWNMNNVLKADFKKNIAEKYGGSYSKAFFDIWHGLDGRGKAVLMDVCEKLRKGPFCIIHYMIDISHGYPQTGENICSRYAEAVNSVYPR